MQDAPAGLAGALLYRPIGEYRDSMLLRAFEVMADATAGQDMYVIGDLTRTRSYISHKAYDEASRMLVERGKARLRIVICDPDPARQFMVGLASELNQMHGLDSEARSVRNMEEAIAALAAMMPGTGPT